MELTSAPQEQPNRRWFFLCLFIALGSFVAGWGFCFLTVWFTPSLNHPRSHEVVNRSGTPAQNPVLTEAASAVPQPQPMTQTQAAQTLEQLQKALQALTTAQSQLTTAQSQSTTQTQLLEQSIASSRALVQTLTHNRNQPPSDLKVTCLVQQPTTPTRMYIRPEDRVTSAPPSELFKPPTK